MTTSQHPAWAVPPPHSPTTPVESIPKGYSPMARVKAFHRAAGVTPFIEEKDAYGRGKLIDLRIKLIKDETKEAFDELLDQKNGSGSWVNLAKELADILVTVYGTADLFEIPLERVMDAVMDSNMSKIGKDGKIEMRADGKILKGPNYKEPDLSFLWDPDDGE